MFEDSTVFNFIGKRSATNVLADWKKSKQRYWTSYLDYCCGVFVSWS